MKWILYHKQKFVKADAELQIFVFGCLMFRSSELFEILKYSGDF